MSDKKQQQDEAIKGIDTTKISVDDEGKLELGKDDLDKVVGGKPGTGGGTNCFHCVNLAKCEV